MSLSQSGSPSTQKPGAFAPAFAELQFHYPFRRYQQMILGMMEGHAGNDQKYHIVAPPGSGKTIIGLELIRRFGRPAVVFAPTTTIQQQWQEKVEMFVDGPGWIEQHTNLDPHRLAEINLLTYQVLSTPGENLAFAERIAIERWVDDLLSSGRADTEAEARQRLVTLEAGNPQAYRREIAKRYRRIKREFLREGNLDGRQFLHPNARDLIDRLVALGTGTVVLDECHHLLDYWAFILRELIRALPEVYVVGLTATLPDPENATEYENYTSLLGDIDFEVPTPAVVKEGNLAPYRELVYFCEPSPREHSYLEEIQKHFEAAVWQVTHATAFQDWLWHTLFPNTDPKGLGNPLGLGEDFEAAFRREPLLCIAAVKYLVELGVPLPLEVPVIEEMVERMSVDDWLILMENYALRALKVSAEPQHQALYGDLRDALLPFGITISERGIRHQRSPGDLVLALSESKDGATVEILRAEAEAMGEKLRAVVITDFERMSARTRRLQGILDPDAGSAVRVFRHLVADPVTELLAPVLVTGKVVLVSARSRRLMEGRIRRWAEDRQAAFTWVWQKTESEQVLRMVGSGPDWSSRTYVSLLTDLFEQGVTRCLVGTRGIFGEGWDTLRLNTLVDLTSVTASTSVQQIRGRSIRLDPEWRSKVAHNWDVVCVGREFDKGDSDLRRFVARHAHTWGIIIHWPPAGWREAVSQAAVAGPGRVVAPLQAPAVAPGQVPSEQGEGILTAMEGRVVRGVAHVDLELAVELATQDFRAVGYEHYSHRMLEAVWQRDRAHELWRVGQPYENLIYSTTLVEAEDIRFRTVYTVGRSLGSVVWRLLTSILAVAAFLWINGAEAVPWAQPSSDPWLGVTLIGLTSIAAASIIAVNGWHIWRILQRTFVQLPADVILLDMGRALFTALQETGAISPSLSDEQVVVVETVAGGYEVFLDQASPEDSNTFSQAYRQMLGPIGDARYLIERDATTLRNWVYRPLWWLVRVALGMREELKAYHRVPDALASHRERAEALAHHWQRYVGGGRLVYTRTDEGRRILLQARAQRRKPIRQMAFEVWR